MKPDRKQQRTVATGCQKSVSVLPREIDMAAICPLDLLKYCDHTQSNNSFAWSFWYVPIQPNFLLKKYSKLCPQGHNRSLELAKTNLKRVPSVRVGGTRRAILSFRRVQIPCDSKNTFCDYQINFSECKEELYRTPCYSASVLWHSTQRIWVWSRNYLVSLSPVFPFWKVKTTTSCSTCPA